METPTDYEMTVLLAAQQQQQQQLLEQAQQAAGGEGMEDVMGDVLSAKQKNTLPVYGNKETMNINPMILSNIQGSAYFKEELYKMKTFHEVIDEIFYKVTACNSHKLLISSPLLLLLSYSTLSSFSTSYSRLTIWSHGRKGAGS